MPDRHHLLIAVVTLAAAAACLFLLRPAQSADKVARIQWRPETTGSARRKAGPWQDGGALKACGAIALAAAAVGGVLMFFDVLPSLP